MLRACPKSTHHFLRRFQAGRQDLCTASGEDLCQILDQRQAVTQLFRGAVDIHSDIACTRLTRHKCLSRVKDGGYTTRKRIPMLCDKPKSALCGRDLEYQSMP